MIRFICPFTFQPSGMVMQYLALMPHYKKVMGLSLLQAFLWVVSLSLCDFSIHLSIDVHVFGLVNW